MVMEKGSKAVVRAMVVAGGKMESLQARGHHHQRRRQQAERKSQKEYLPECAILCQHTLNLYYKFLRVRILFWAPRHFKWI